MRIFLGKYSWSLKVSPQTTPNVLGIQRVHGFEISFYLFNQVKKDPCYNFLNLDLTKEYEKAGKWRGQWEGFCIMGQKCEKMMGH